MKTQELTKYEYSRIIGARAYQLSLGAPPLIKTPETHTSFIDVAKSELEEGVIPLQVLA